ncbi:MAG: ATP-binding cassette domain-containing protein [Phycisphaerae bacterium]|nr:ABC transporter ATP-binding protein/permease [Phycisphaerae bacterium]NUQ45422.1 ATP-binding cassette domain-containing protein [Phycisphaerae bacterium]
MKLAPPTSADGRPDDRHARHKAKSLHHFFRVLRHTRPHRRLLVPAIACIIIVAMSYSASIAAILPVLQAIIRPEGVPTWVYRTIAERRLKADLAVFTRDDGETVHPSFDPAVILWRFHDDSPLKTLVRSSELPILITQVGDAAMDEGRVASHILRSLADRPEEDATRITYVPRARASQADAARSVETPLRHVGAAWRMARWAAAKLPESRDARDKLKALAMILAGMFTIQLIGGSARFAGEYLIAVVAGRTLVGIRRQMYRKVLRLPVSFFARHGTSDVMSRFVQDSQAIYRGLTYIFSQSIREPLKAIGVFGVALYLNWRITLTAAIGAPVAILIIRAFGRRIRKRSRRLLEGYSRMLTALEGALLGIRVVKGYGGESYERRHLYAVDWHMFRQQAGIEKIDALTSPLFEVLGYFFGALVTLYFANQVMTHRLDAEEFMLMVVCLGAMFDPVRKLSNFYNRIQQANAAAERVFELIDMPDEKSSAAARALPPLSNAIEFRNVTFAYPGANRPAVVDVSFTVQRGERIAIVGPNGSGKTTLLSLLMRFFDPIEGAILFDGVDIRTASLNSLRAQFGLVTQDAVVFADTVANNIAYGDPPLLWKLNLRKRRPDRPYAAQNGDARVISAARAAYADEFISRMPQGYDTHVGEHGATLSGGQKQRLAIARAILANAPILIFDEATSQIDSDSEQKIHDALERFMVDRTAFIIAHRFSTIQTADRIIVMDQGRIIAAGSHAELLASCAFYRTLFETQLQRPESSRGAAGPV